MEDMASSEAYDPGRYDRPSVTVDIVVLGIMDGRPVVLLTRRRQSPFAGRWTLPGGFVGIDEALEAAARRVLADKGGLVGPVPEQVHCFGAVDRDPRMRIVSIAHRVLLTPAELAALTLDAGQRLATIDVTGAVRIDGDTIALGFDHAAIVALTLDRLRGGIDDAAFALLPDRFTLRDLQGVQEAVLGRALNKPAFRRRMLDSGRITPTGDREAGTAFRPAAFYTRTIKD
ncbi:hypothetical protein ASE78_06010 [Sphingomonas sp. Leaf25]|nr:hypothetical protein ASE78_06010 [Sphingomonas sp. Leaf25]